MRHISTTRSDYLSETHKISRKISLERQTCLSKPTSHNGAQASPYEFPKTSQMTWESQKELQSNCRWMATCSVSENPIPTSTK